MRLQEFKLSKNQWELLISSADKHEAGPELVDLVKHAYAVTPRGSMIQSLKDVIPSDWNVIDWDHDPDIDACVFYRRNRPGENWTGYKIQGIGHDGTRTSKDKAISKVTSMLSRPGVWIESSDALRHVLHRMNAPAVTDTETLQALFGDRNLKMLGPDTYTRVLQNGERIKETVFGMPQVTSNPNAALNEVEEQEHRYTTAYHVTTTEYADEILYGGLDPYDGKAFLVVDQGNYKKLRDELHTVTQWMYAKNDDMPLTLLQVDIRGLPLAYEHGWFFSTQTIPPERIKDLGEDELARHA